MMKPLFAVLWVLALLSLISSISPAQAQTAIKAGPAEPFYDVTREVTLKGTVSSLVTKHSPGMIPGPYLFLETPSGEVAANLGRFALRGNGALSVAVGDQVEVTGTMKTLGGKQVFVVRSVKAGEQIYLMRNQYGIPVSPQARERAGQNAAQQQGEEL